MCVDMCQGTSREVTEAACHDGCLFDLEDDPTEQKNLYQQESQIVARLLARLKLERASFFENRDSFPKTSCEGPEGQHCACWLARHRYGGFLGPYALLDQPLSTVVV